MKCRFRSGPAPGGTAFTVACFASVALLIAGCGGENSQSVPGRASQRNLPKLGEYMVPLDDGRLQVAPPEGWEIGSRKTGYVIWFKKSGKSSYPCILISAEDYDATPTVTGKNVKVFASQIRDRLEESGKSSKGVGPLEVGPFDGVSYRRIGKTKQKFNIIVLDRLIVQTAVDGRLYTFELRSPQDEFAAVEDAVLAVAAGAKFPESEAKAPVETKADERKPVEKKPAEKKPAEKTAAEQKPADGKPPEGESGKPAADDTQKEKAKTAPKESAKKKPPAKKPESPKKKPAKKKGGDSEFELLDDDEL